MGSDLYRAFTLFPLEFLMPKNLIEDIPLYIYLILSYLFHFSNYVAPCFVFFFFFRKCEWKTHLNNTHTHTHTHPLKFSKLLLFCHRYKGSLNTWLGISQNSSLCWLGPKHSLHRNIGQLCFCMAHELRMDFTFFWWLEKN